jgi:hypothetical protein
MIWGLVAHLVCDWMFQNSWMAENKNSLKHPAAWVHSGIHFLGSLLVFPWWGALIVFATHILIDTRKPLLWWADVMRQTKLEPMSPILAGRLAERRNVREDIVAMTVVFWRDQVAHVLVLALASLLTAFLVGR